MITKEEILEGLEEEFLEDRDIFKVWRIKKEDGYHYYLGYRTENTFQSFMSDVIPILHCFDYITPDRKPQMIETVGLFGKESTIAFIESLRGVKDAETWEENTNS